MIWCKQHDQIHVDQSEKLGGNPSSHFDRSCYFNLLGEPHLNANICKQDYAYLNSLLGSTFH